MTLEAFRAVAREAIQGGAAYYGQCFIDHRDDTLYDVTRWVNAPDIACDEYWTREHPDYHIAKRRMMLNEQTLHYAAVGALTPTEP